MNKWIKKTLAISAISLSSQAYALPITIEVVGAHWTDVNASTNVDFINTDGITGDEEIRWGNPVGTTGKSGYRFDGAAPPALVVETDTSFTIGELTHINFPIFGGFLESAQLNITADISVGGQSISEGPFTFSFLHNETPNLGCSPVPECTNDLVTFVNLDTSDRFLINNQEHTLNIEGFFQNGFLTNTFSSPEGQFNTAELIGSFSAPSISVPEPGSVLLLSLGVLGLVAARRRTR